LATALTKIFTNNCCRRQRQVVEHVTTLFDQLPCMRKGDIEERGNAQQCNQPNQGCHQQISETVRKPSHESFLNGLCKWEKGSTLLCIVDLYRLLYPR